jgi:ribosomal protein L11
MPAPFPAFCELPLPLALPDDPFGERSSGRAHFVSIVLTQRSRGKTNGWAPSRKVVTNGIASRSFHCSHVKPAIFVMLKSSAAVTKGFGGSGVGERGHVKVAQHKQIHKEKKEKKNKTKINKRLKEKESEIIIKF